MRASQCDSILYHPPAFCMAATRGIGRVIGVLLLVQMVGGVLVNFALTAPLFGSPGFLVNAAPHSMQIGLSALLGLAIGAMSVGIAVSAYPVFRQYSQAMALWFVALCAVSLSVAAVENINVMSLVSLSEAYAKANATERDLFQTLKVVVASARNGFSLDALAQIAMRASLTVRLGATGSYRHG